MGLFDIVLKRGASEEVDAEGAGEDIDTSTMSENDFINFAFKILLDNRVVSTGEYTVPFSTQEEWDKWLTWAGRQGKFARTLRTLAKTAMSYTFEGEDEKALEAVNKMATTVHLKTKFINAMKDWYKYGRCFIELDWEITSVGDKETGRDLKNVKVPRPASIKVFRDSKEDLDKLKTAWPELQKSNAEYFATLEEGGGDEVIGFVQHWNRAHEKKAIFFEPEELIFIPRDPDEIFPDGVALATENYTNLMNKWGIERTQAIMAKRHTDPKLMFQLGKQWWKDLSTVKTKIEASGLKAGTDFYYPEGITVDIVEQKASGMPTIKAQEHLENQVNAGTGFADSFTDSESSNKSVGEIQMQFFERDIRPDRSVFAEILENRLIIPYTVSQGFNEEDAPTFKFEDLTPQDEIEKTKALVPYLPYMTDSQLTKVFDDLGYPLGEDEEPMRPEQPAQLIAQLASSKNLPKSVVISSKDAKEELEEELALYKAELEGVVGLGGRPPTELGNKARTKTIIEKVGPDKFELTEERADG